MRAWQTDKPLLLAPAFLMLLLTGCSNALHWADSEDSSSAHAHAATVAQNMIGVPYQWNGSTPSGFDCSGLVQYAYNEAGIGVPRTSRAQYSAAQPVQLNQARTGDLLFFNFDGRISHVGIYLGNDRFVHAPSSGKQVEIASLKQAPYRDRFVTAGRID